MFSALVQAKYILQQILKCCPKITTSHTSYDSLILFGQKCMCAFMQQFLFEPYPKRELETKDLTTCDEFAKRYVLLQLVRKKMSLLISYFIPSQYTLKTKPEISLLHSCANHN